MALNANRYRDLKKDSEGGSGPSQDFMRLKPGKNYVRIFKFSHVVNQRDYDIGLYRKGPNSPKIGDQVEEITRQYQVHFISGSAPIMCMINKRNCDLCEEAQSLTVSGKKQDGRMLRAQTRYAMNVVDMNNPKEGVKRIDLTSQAFNGILAQYLSKIDDGIPEDTIFGVTGRDFIIEYNKGTDDISKTYVVTLRDKERSDVLGTDLLPKVVDLFRDPKLDPVDAPPMDKIDPSAPPFTLEGGAPAPELKKETKLKSSKKIPLEDKASGGPESMVGKKISFMDGETKVTAVISKFDGKLFHAKADNGEVFGLDPTEKFELI